MDASYVAFTAADADLGDAPRSTNSPRGTVRNYLSNAMSKLGVTHRNAAVTTARARGWI